MQNVVTDPMSKYQTKLSLSFIKNSGQEDTRAHFTASYKGRHFFFSSDRITSVELEPIDETVPEIDDFKKLKVAPENPRNGVALELSFVNANPALAPEGVTQQSGKHHYLKGTNSSKWRNGVPHYKELRYVAVWEGVDLELSANSDGMKMNWVLDDPNRVPSIRLNWEGADSLELDATGNLLIHHVLGTLTDLSPIAYQEIDGERKPVDCVYRLYGSFVLGFELTGNYLENTSLIIEPILTYATYGGGTDAIVTKFASNGDSLIYSTYLGGNDNNNGISISLDTQECAYVTGLTRSADFPTTPGAFQTTPGAFQKTYGGGPVDTFASKLSPGGESLLASTYLGGNSSDPNYGGTIDTQGRIRATGYTSSPNFPLTPEVIPSILDGGSNIYISIFSTDLTKLLVSYCLGGGVGRDIATWPEGAVYATGETVSTAFPATPGAYQTTLNGTVDAFVTKTGFAFYRQASVEIEGLI